MTPSLRSITRSVAESMSVPIRAIRSQSRLPRVVLAGADQ
jgi:hypothetical protein